MHLFLLTIWTFIKEWDQWLFIKINNQLTNPFFDFIMPIVRTPMYWAPLYLFLLFFVVLNFKSKGGWWMLCFICTVALTDMISTFVFKNGVQRLRPCQDPGFYYHVRLLVKNCSYGYSFVSNHASNHFGMATFFFFTFRHVLGKWTALVFIWAALISYAQVYVGVHYPVDVLGGTIIGVIFGLFMSMFFNKKWGFAIFGKQPAV
jgi:membrane-associated phospholipid phosphatase